MITDSYVLARRLHYVGIKSQGGNQYVSRTSY